MIFLLMQKFMIQIVFNEEKKISCMMICDMLALFFGDVSLEIFIGLELKYLLEIYENIL